MYFGDLPKPLEIEVVLFLGGSCNSDIIDVSKCALQLIAVNDVVDGALEHSHSIGNSKRDPAEMVEFAIPFKGCIGFLFLPNRDLMVS